MRHNLSGIPICMVHSNCICICDRKNVNRSFFGSNDAEESREWRIEQNETKRITHAHTYILHTQMSCLSHSLHKQLDWIQLVFFLTHNSGAPRCNHL